MDGPHMLINVGTVDKIIIMQPFTI